MILIITHKMDFTVDYIIQIFNQSKIPYYRFNCETLLQNKNSIQISNDNLTYLLNGKNNFKSIWFRRTKFPELSGLSISEQIYINTEIETFFKSLYSIIEGKWLSNPFKVYEAENKLYQLKIAKKIGLDIPETLVTTDKDVLLQFINKHHNVIIKPLSQTRIYNSNSSVGFIFTNLLSLADVNKIEMSLLTPSIFQRYIEKAIELRVTVVGKKVFAAGVDSQSEIETKIDWRRKKLKFFKIILPTEIENKCIKLVSELNLEFGAIDLILTPDNKYIFLEINPNGQWVWIENQTNLKISNEIINLLNC